MLYPVYVHKEGESAYGVTFPDFPGCFAASDELQGIPAASQEAVEAHFYGDEAGVPAPSTPEKWQGEADYQGGYWMLVEIDLSKISTKAVRLNISLPENLVHRIDKAANDRRLSRSAFLALAAEHEMTAH